MGLLFLFLSLLTKASAFERGTTRSACLHHQRNQSTRVTHGVTLASLSGILQHKTRATTDRECQMALNRKLLRIVYTKSREMGNYRVSFTPNRVKLEIIAYLLCHIALNRKLRVNSKIGVNF
jgi:hypothetical protein